MKMRGAPINEGSHKCNGMLLAVCRTAMAEIITLSMVGKDERNSRTNSVASDLLVGADIDRISRLPFAWA